GDSPVTSKGVDREIAWAFRRWVQTQAAHSPLLLVFEDIHWAEPALLGLIEYLATWSGEAPVLILCLARPELLDKRPGWAAGRFQSSRIVLEPLNRQESAALIGALLTIEGLPDRLRNEMLERAGGNPLFVEELIRMLLDEGTIIRSGNRWTAAPMADEVKVPKTVEALIRARLDTLPARERRALQAGAVIGRTFERPMLDHLLDDAEGLEIALENLVLRDLVSEEPLPGGQAFYRFKHILVRDVAYRLGRYAQAKEKAIRVAAAARAIGRKDLEGSALLSQGRAMWIGDPEGGAEKGLARLTEAHALLQGTGDLAHLQEAAFQLGYGGWWFGKLEEAWPRWAEARALSRQLGDPGLEARALVMLAGIRYHMGRIAEALAMRREAVALSETGGSRANWAAAVVRHAQLVALTTSLDEGL